MAPGTDTVASPRQGLKSEQSLAGNRHGWPGTFA